MRRLLLKIKEELLRNYEVVVIVIMVATLIATLFG